MNHGFNLEAANDRIIDVYGTHVPTSIIAIMKADQRKADYPYIGNIRHNPRIIIGAGTTGDGAAALAQMGVNP